MACALVVQHVDAEGPGWLEPWLAEHGVSLDVRRPYRGDRLPDRPDPGQVQALIVMGGPMSANSTDEPWLAPTRALLRGAVHSGLPVLGICLGAQLLAVGCGGAVERGGAGPELGLGGVQLTAAASADPLFTGAGPTLPVVQWHWDTVTRLPPDATLLASSDAYPVQAFRVGAAAWGLQFHVEAPLPLVVSWARADAGGVRAAGLDPVELVGELADGEPAALPHWRALVARFARVVTAAT